MEQLIGYVVQGESLKFVKFSGLFTTFSFTSYTIDPIVLIKKTEDGISIFVVYVDNILVTKSDEAGISTTKAYLQQHHNIHDLETPWYFLRIEFTYQDGKVTLT
ncbi:unnamed protein product [Spirodela intermedia]|uniref:Uncharacterized protein n=1 Tax=Spirodela intermedia TaxID=51605 RepID=A0A7I8K2W6_SPIIN|nr:unnamed protein product [Spirodela intermedia]